jgi:hypothetical protein
MSPVIINPRGLASDPLVVQGDPGDNRFILDQFGRRNNFIIESPAATNLVPFSREGSIRTADGGR